MNQLLDHKERTKITKKSRFQKYIIWLIGIVLLIDGVVGFAAYFYKMNTTWMNFSFSLMQIYMGLKFILSRPSIGDLLLSFLMLTFLTFSVYSSTFTSVVRNGIYFELGTGEDTLQSGVEYTMYFEMSHPSRGLDIAVDLLYLTLMLLSIYVTISRLFSFTKKVDTPQEVHLS